jgi:hypothetical protein
MRAISSDRSMKRSGSRLRSTRARRRESWASQKGDLPLYAEAAPDLFLDIIEQDLNTEDPKILSLLKPASPEIYSLSPRNGSRGASSA